MPSATEDRSLGDRLPATLTDDLPSIATGIVVAMPVAYGVRWWTNDFAASFFVLILAGVSVPGLVDRFAPATSPGSEIRWTIAGCAVAIGAFLVLFLALDALLAGTVAAAIAFVVVSLGMPVLLARLTGA